MDPIVKNIILILAVILIALSAFILPLLPKAWAWMKQKVLNWLFKGIVFGLALVGAWSLADLAYRTQANSAITRARSQGEYLLYKSFTNIPATPELSRKFIIPRIELTIVGDRAQFDWPWAQDPKNKVMGYARIYPQKSATKQIFLLGRQVDGKILLNHETFGHELIHILEHSYDNSFFNPDSLTKAGY